MISETQHVKSLLIIYRFGDCTLRISSIYLQHRCSKMKNNTSEKPKKVFFFWRR